MQLVSTEPQRGGLGSSVRPTARRRTGGRYGGLVKQSVLEAAAEKGIRVGFASSSSIYGNADDYPLREDAGPTPLSLYGVQAGL
jgi:hypothetical protein